jgi:hypothetical protein
MMPGDGSFERNGGWIAVGLVATLAGLWLVGLIGRALGVW